MTSDTREVLSALLDREPVDPDQLSNVLEDPDARRLLVDFVKLRWQLTEHDETPLAPVVANPRIRHLHERSWGRAAAAAIVLAGTAAGGFWVGERRAEERPPEPARVVEFKPGVDWQSTR